MNNMDIDSFVDCLNYYIKEERDSKNIENKGLLVVQKTIIPNKHFKVYKNFNIIIWYIDIKSKFKGRLISCNQMFRATKEQEDIVLNSISKEIISKLFTLVRSNDFNLIIEGNYGERKSKESTTEHKDE